MGAKVVSAIRATDDDDIVRLAAGFELSQRLLEVAFLNDDFGLLDLVDGAAVRAFQRVFTRFKPKLRATFFARKLLYSHAKGSWVTG